MKPSEVAVALDALKRSTGWGLFAESLRAQKRTARGVMLTSLDPMEIARATGRYASAREALAWLDGNLNAALEQMKQDQLSLP